MGVQWTTSPLLSAPAGAASVSLTPGAGAWADSAWGELIASAPAALTLMGITVTPGQAHGFEVDLGVGAAGAESVVATFKGASAAFPYAGSPDYMNPPGAFVLPVGLAVVAAGQRVAARVRRVSTVSTAAWNVGLLYYAGAIVGSVTTTTKPVKAVPVNGSADLQSTGAWTNGSWVQVVASTATAWVLVGVMLGESAVSRFEVDLGIGAAGAETVALTLKAYHPTSQTPTPSIVMLPNPFTGIGASVRVAARMRHDEAGTNYLSVGCLYVEAPL